MNKKCRMISLALVFVLSSSGLWNVSDAAGRLKLKATGEGAASSQNDGSSSSSSGSIPESMPTSPVTLDGSTYTPIPGSTFVRAPDGGTYNLRGYGFSIQDLHNALIASGRISAASNDDKGPVQSQNQASADFFLK